MKKIVLIIAALVMCDVMFAMQTGYSAGVEKTIKKEKECLLKGLLAQEPLKRTIALRKMFQRCTPQVQQHQVEKKIVEYLRHIDTFLAFSQHPALNISKCRAAKYCVRNVSDLFIKQDLMCFDWIATHATKIYQLNDDLQEECALEIKKAKNSIKKIINDLEFMPPMNEDGECY